MNKKKEDTNLIAFCGLYCGDCHGYTGKIPNLARDLRKELREIHYDKFASFISKYSFGKDFKNYDEWYNNDFNIILVFKYQMSEFLAIPYSYLLLYLNFGGRI